MSKFYVTPEIISSATAVLGKAFPAMLGFIDAGKHAAGVEAYVSTVTSINNARVRETYRARMSELNSLSRRWICLVSGKVPHTA